VGTQEVIKERGTHNWLTVGAWLLLALGLTAAFGHNFVEMWHRWYPAWDRSGTTLYQAITQGQSYYSHAPLVPLVSLVMIALLVRYTSIPSNPRRVIGLAVLIFALLFHFISCFARVNFASGFAFVLVLTGLVLFLWGSKALGRLWFPLVFLVFMVPLPELSIAQLNFRLKIAAADWGVQLANLIGIIVERSGNRVFLEGDKSMIIANVCNGLRTLISVMAFGAMYAYVCRLRGWQRISLFAMSVPVAVVSNALRIMTLILVADVWDVETATGWYHDFSGLMILVIAFTMLFGWEKLLLWLHRLFGKPIGTAPLEGPRRAASDGSQTQRLLGALSTLPGWSAVALVALAAAGSSWLNRAEKGFWDERLLKEALPAEVQIDGQQWHSYVLDFDKKVLLVLETEDAILRRYVHAREPFVDFCVIFSQDNRKGTHPPDLCLEGGGQDIIAKKSVVVSGIEDHDDLPCRELVVHSGPKRTYYLYTYKCGDTYTRSFWRQQFVIFANGLRNRNAGGALIRVSTPVTTTLADARQRAMTFLRIGMPYLDRCLP